MFDLRYNTRIQAGLDLGLTIFICVILTVFSIYFSKDAQELIIGPIESMIQRVNKIAENPVKAAQEQEIEDVAKAMAMTNRSVVTKDKSAPLETLVLEQTFIKIGALLALGFGEAGSEIIAKNVKRGGGEVDPLIPGKKTYCIFGFCDIRRFSDTTEVLQKDIMIFVNEIAKIVHNTVNHFSGSANKNIGEAFLLVWKFPHECILEDSLTGEVSLLLNHHTVELADMAVIAFLKTIANVHKSPKVTAYESHPGLIAVMPGFNVTMGFGLHQGWAIEGAIGSEFKIDASYLSPNVNLASRLEAATRQFGVHLLVSDALHNICSRQTQKFFRKVDRVTVKGSKVPIELYTVDLDLTVLEIANEFDESFSDLKQARAYAYIRREKLNEAVKYKDYHVARLFNDDKDLRMMRKNISKAFMNAFSTALEDYLKGNWEEAKTGFIRARIIKGEPDGPMDVLLEFMQENGGRAPSNWSGFRELHDK